ncbi:MAG: hypothetical protein K8R23_07495 [Chthoniobacter sp.]|nr:hypothetical protein [Chthoniobacter sp.]
MKLFFVLLLIVTLPACGHEPAAARAFAPPPLSPPAAEDYTGMVARLAAQRRALEGERRQHGVSEQLLAEARLLYCQSFAELAGQWMGTPWDFNGTTQTPRVGQIACGYFVSTLLRDAGFVVERSRLGQQASEVIARTMTTREFMRARSEESLDTFVAACRKHPPGVYLVGLDFHTGYLVNDGAELWFVHASYGQAARYVLVEKAGESAYLGNSKYRHVAFLTEDRNFLLGWLAGKRWVTAR